MYYTPVGQSCSRLEYTSVKAHGVDDVEECSATKEMRTEGLLCSGRQLRLCKWSH